MNKRYFLRRFSLSALLSFLSIMIFAQSSVDSTAEGMNSTMRSHDKIYVVMAVCLTILVVLFLYLIRIDLKVSKKEKVS